VRKAGVVVKELVDVADVRYAVLEVPRTEGGSQRFVVAYPNEDCLYDVIAAPRIVACGFCSREAALESTETRVSTATKSDPDPALRLFRRSLVSFYNDAVTAAILMFSSRNIISSAIRTFLAASF